MLFLIDFVHYSKLTAGLLTESCGMISPWPSVGGGSGPSPPLPVRTIVLLVLAIITQARFKVTVSWKN